MYESTSYGIRQRFTGKTAQVSKMYLSGKKDITSFTLFFKEQTS